MFESLSPSAKLWIFVTNEDIRREQLAPLREGLAQFTAKWKAHGSTVQGEFEILAERFIVLAADEAMTKVSGCSIDSLFRAVKDATQSAGLSLLDEAHVVYRDGARIVSCARPEFKARIASGTVTSESTVFDTTLGTLSAFQSGKFELPLKDSWHGKAFL